MNIVLKETNPKMKKLKESTHLALGRQSDYVALLLSYHFFHCGNCATWWAPSPGFNNKQEGPRPAKEYTFTSNLVLGLGSTHGALY